MNKADERKIEHHFVRVASLADEWEVCAEGCTVVTVVATARVMLRKGFRSSTLRTRSGRWHSCAPSRANCCGGPMSPTEAPRHRGN
jgi:hypothetical protein